MTLEEAVDRAFRGCLQPCQAGQPAGAGRRILAVSVDGETQRFTAPEEVDPGEVSELLAIWLRKMVDVH